MEAKMAATIKEAGRTDMPVDAGPQVHFIYGVGIDLWRLDASRTLLTSEVHGDRRDVSRLTLYTTADKSESGSLG
jgi:hypothetical protein